MLFEIILLAGLGLAGFFLFGKPEPEPIFGVYKEPGKWYYLKYALFYCIMLTRKLIGNFTKGVNRTGYGLKSHPTLADMDVAQKLSPHSKAFDAVFFMATTKDGFYLVGGAERRHNGVVNGLFYVAVPGVGLLCSSKIPDTILHGARENEFGAEGIRFIPIEPMKHWRVEFEGDMWHHDDPNKTSKVVVHGDWKSNLPYFDFDTDSNISTMCSAIARESWSREYFEFLKNAHQSHYEQMGTLKATVTLDGKEYSLDGQAFRDHSYGFKRDWKLMHRYIFHMLFLEDGTTASIGVICQPCTCSVLKIGYVYKPDGTLYPLEWCDLQLYQHGENGSPPRDHAFSFKAGGIVYRVQVDVEYESIHYKGEEREARMVERFVRYHVNGKIKGRGVSEFHYNNSNDVKRGTV